MKGRGAQGGHREGPGGPREGHGPRAGTGLALRAQGTQGVREALAVFSAISTTKVSATLLRMVRPSSGSFSRKSSCRMENKRKILQKRNTLMIYRKSADSTPFCSKLWTSYCDCETDGRQHPGVHSTRSLQHFSHNTYFYATGSPGQLHQHEYCQINGTRKTSEQ